MDLESPVQIVTGDATQGHISLVAGLGGGILRINDGEGRSVLFLGAGLLNAAVLDVGGAGFNGTIFVKNAAGKTILNVDGRDAEIEVRNDAGQTTVLINGREGDVSLLGADVAEEFQIVDGDPALPGTVMTIECSGRLRQCTDSYDRRVAGVVAGLEERRPGIVIGRALADGQRRPIALAGRVYCRVDASAEPIETGDLLTSSATPGHAMKASDARRAFGAVLGKALQPLPAGRGLVPVLVSLQ